MAFVNNGAGLRLFNNVVEDLRAAGEYVDEDIIEYTKDSILEANLYIDIIVEDEEENLINVTTDSDLPFWEWDGPSVFINEEGTTDKDARDAITDLVNNMLAIASSDNIEPFIYDTLDTEPPAEMVELESVLTEAPRPIKIDADTARSGLRGGTDFDMLDISRKNIAAEKAENTKKEAAAKLQEIKNHPAFTDNSPISRIKAFFDVLVPSLGKADTVAGEIIRAAVRLGFRWYNDGDFFYMGYGKETCGSSALYLHYIAKPLRDYILDMPDCEDRDDLYEREIDSLLTQVMDYVLANPHLIAEENTIDSRTFKSNIDLSDYEPRFTFDLDYSDIVQSYLDSGKIDTSDIESEINDWYIDDNPDVTCYSSYCEISDLTVEGLHNLESMMDPWSDFEVYLEDTYGTPFDDITLDVTDLTVEAIDEHDISLVDEVCAFLNIYAGDLNVEQYGSDTLEFTNIPDRGTFEALIDFDSHAFEDYIIDKYGPGELE